MPRIARKRYAQAAALRRVRETLNAYSEAEFAAFLAGYGAAHTPGVDLVRILRSMGRGDAVERVLAATPGNAELSAAMTDWHRALRHGV